MVLLENHGIFVAGDTIEQIKEVMDFVMSAIKASIIKTPDFGAVKDKEGIDEFKAQIKNVLGADANSIIYFNNTEISRLIADKQAFSAVDYAFTPDHMVYYKHTALFIETEMPVNDEVLKYKAKFGFLPRVIAVKDIGVFACGGDVKQADRVL